MFHKLDEVEAHFQDVEVRLTSPDVVSNQMLFQQLSKEHSNLQPLVQTYREYRKLKNDFLANEQLIKDDSGELKQMALEDNSQLAPQLDKLERRLKILLLPQDPNDDKNILLEIRPAAGGDESPVVGCRIGLNHYL